jgi:hypothetical protein
MATPTSQPIHFDRQLTGPEISVGGHTIRPVARMTGQQASGGNGASGWARAAVRVTPTEVIARRGDGAEQRLPVTDPTRMVLRSMAWTAGAVTALCLVVMLITRIVRGRG